MLSGASRPRYRRPSEEKMPANNRLRFLAASALLLASQISTAQESSRPPRDGSGLSLGTGLTYSSGTYGTSDTTRIVSIPFIAQVESGRWTLKLTVPYIEISGNGNVLPGVGRVENSNPRGRGRGAGSTTGAASGMGDVVAAATYNYFYDSASEAGVNLTGKIKFGTADPNKGLGTGRNDYGAQVDVYKAFDPLTLYAGLGYTILGSSEFIHLNNVFNVTAGGLLKIDGARSVGLQYDARERASAASGPLREMSAFYFRKLDRNWNMQAYLSKGFANGSPDWGVGGIFMHAF